MKRRGMEQANKAKMKRHEKGLLKDKWRREGLCLWCGEKVIDGTNVCERHSRIFSEAGRKGKAVATSQQGEEIAPAQFSVSLAGCAEVNRWEDRNDED